MAAQLPLGAHVLIRDRAPLPDQSAEQSAATGGRAKRLELTLQTAITNSMFQYFGYRVVAADAPLARQHVCPLLLEKRTRRLGTSRFEVVGLVQPQDADVDECAAAFWAELETERDPPAAG